MDYTKLFHDKTAFERECLQQRMELYGFKNMARMELFLWDLELFLQIQKRLGEHIVLKGGAATQFYLPIEAQRTSVDIDMIFCGTDEAVKNTLDDITEELKENSEFFRFVEHIPKNPKTNLPMHTYFVDVPSVLSYKERNAAEGTVDKQELKIEFIMDTEDWEYTRKTGENIFAVQSSFEYQLLPVSHLFADKFTTIGCNTIGVQNERMDEQVKQFYDVVMLTKYQLDELDISEVRKKYLNRAEKEWYDRNDSPYDLQEIIADVRKQLYRYSMVDSGEDIELKKYINDFKALYLNSKVEFNPQFVACGAALVRLMYEAILEGKNWDLVKKALAIEELLELNQYEGKAKGSKTKEIRQMLIQEFASYSAIPANILKGKNLKRIFWAIVDKDNLEEIRDKVLQLIG
ncbi:MAG: nucleotidyl transferase AbiEii/AbiGii toxin family protein [Lachnospiraceae bacterium]